MKTMRVMRKDGQEAIINAEDFDPELYEDLDAAPAPKPTKKGKAAPEPAPAPLIEPDDESEM